MTTKARKISLSTSTKVENPGTDVTLKVLGQVLHEASLRGIDLAASFSHFDRLCKETVGINEFISALEDLHIIPPAPGGVLEKMARNCIDAISCGKSREFFNKEDFIKYFSRDKLQQQTTKQYNNSQVAPSLPHSGSVFSLHHKKLLEESSQFDQSQLQSSRSISGKKTSRKRRPIVSLPDWAHDRSKRALKELESMQKRSKKGYNSDNTFPEGPSPQDEDDKDVEGNDDENNGSDASSARSTPHYDQKDFDLKKELHLPLSVRLQKDPYHFDLSPRWRRFDVDQDTTIGYAILTNDTIPSMPMKSSIPASSAFSMDSDDPRQFTSFRLTVFLDVFQQLETLEKFFEPLLVHFPRGKILLCGFPTKMNDKRILNNDFFSFCYSKLLSHLIETTREWLPQPKIGVGAVPQYLVAFGSGVNIALHFCAIQAHEAAITGSKLHLFLQSLGGIVLINGCSHMSESVRSNLNRIKKNLAQSSRTEVVETLVSTLFSEYFLTQVSKSRQAAMETFFSTRNRFIEQEGLLSLQLLIQGLTKNSDLRDQMSNLVAIQGFSAPFLLVHGTHDALFPASQVDSFLNVFKDSGNVANRTSASSSSISPRKYRRNATTFSGARAMDGAKSSESVEGDLEESRQSPLKQYESLEECLNGSFAAQVSQSELLSIYGKESDEKQVHIHISWLKSGHEILQERPSFFYDYLKKLILVDLNPPPPPQLPLLDLETSIYHPSTTSSDQKPHRGSRNSSRSGSRPDMSTSNSMEHVDMMTEEDVEEEQDVDFIDTLDPEVGEYFRLHGLKQIQQDLYDRGLEGSGKDKEILSLFNKIFVEEKQKALEKKLKKEARDVHAAKFLAEKHAQEIEDLALAIKQKELNLQNVRKEIDQQKQLFKEMEQQQKIAARTFMEHTQMNLEDAFSWKIEEMYRQEEITKERNVVASIQVASLVAERAEKIRQEQELEQEAKRLEVQQQRRRELIRLEKDFEKNELFCSGVESYFLDVPPEMSLYKSLSMGSTQVTKDLEHLRAQKIQKLQWHGESTKASDYAKQVFEEKSLALRNLKRVISKAQTTGTIARAGLGNVRIVPITPKELEELQQKMSQLEVEVNGLQNEASMKANEVIVLDKLLQKLSVLIKRNEKFMVEMLAKVEGTIEKGEEKILLLREDMENNETKQQLNEETQVFTHARYELVEAEIQKLNAATTEFFDTSLRVAGSVQRIQRSVFLQELTQEKKQLEMKTRTLKEEYVTLQEEQVTLDSCLHQVASQTFELTQVKKYMEQVALAAVNSMNQDESNPIRTMPDTLQQQQLEQDENGKRNAADKIRFKKNGLRSKEEKEWVALDFLVNFPFYYKNLTGEEIERMRLDPECQQTNLKKEDVERLLTLPSRLCLALTFLKSKEEIRAHYLLRKYTFEDGEACFNKMDDEFTLYSSDALASSSNSSRVSVVKKLEEIPSEIIRVATVETAIESPLQIPRGKSVLFNEKDTDHVVLLKETDRHLTPHKSVTHTIRLPKNVGALSLMVSIVFQGQFGTTGYRVGRLSGMLYCLPRIPSDANDQNNWMEEVPALEMISSLGEKEEYRAPLPVGKCLYEKDVALCTSKSLGRLILRHDPIQKPLDSSALYQLVLGAPVQTIYSIEVVVKTAKFAIDVFKEKRLDALKKQSLLPQKKEEVANLFLTMRLSERKKRLARQTASKAKEKADEHEQLMIMKTQELEKDNQLNQLDHDTRKKLAMEIAAAEKEFTTQCFLFASREKEAQDIEKALQDLTKMHCDLLEECDAMERDLLKYRQHLPLLATAVTNEDAEGARIARELNVEYVGPKSSKIRWAELAAMKAKLPSMMTPAEKLRRKYKKGVEVLEKKERQWILLDRILYPEVYEWESKNALNPDDHAVEAAVSELASDSKENNVILSLGSLATVSDPRKKLRLHGKIPTLSKEEEQLAVLSQMELERILRTPWNLLHTREIKIRKIFALFRDDIAGNRNATLSTKKQKHKPGQVHSLASLIRGQKLSELTPEEKEFVVYDKLLNPVYYPVNSKNLLAQFKAANSRPNSPTNKRPNLPGNRPHSPSYRTATANGRNAKEAAAMPSAGRGLIPVRDTPPPTLTREDLVLALNTPEDELYELSVDHLRARNLLIKYDPQLSTNLLEAARMKQEVNYETVEIDVDARCRLVFQELERAIANTQNEFMDSSVLHSTPQRFPTKVFRLELEKELDRLLISQLEEKEKFELKHLFDHQKNDSSLKKYGLGKDEPMVVSDSDSDEEAQIVRDILLKKKKEEEESNTKAKRGVRGKTNQTKSIMKQRREIKHALQGRTLEEKRLVFIQQELGPGGCMACRANPCNWKPYLQETNTIIQTRVEIVQEELERVKRTSDVTLSTSVALTAIKAGTKEIVMRKTDLFDELTFELKIWGKNLRLREVDAEFHATFSHIEDFFETKALHGFSQVQMKGKVQKALHREHNVLVANLTAYEVVEDILEYMLEGWIFGERESERQVLGYVPSLKREGPLSMHDLRRLEQEKRQLDALYQKEEENVQGIPREKWKPIEVEAFKIDQNKKAVKKGSELDKQLTETENALKFGLFCMTLMYFRGLSMLKKQKTIWSTSASSSTTRKTSAEKIRMEQENKNVLLRQQKAVFYEEKAKKGQSRRQKMEQEKLEAYRKKLAQQNQKAKKETKAALSIQRVYRGHLGRITGKKWMLRRKEIDAQKALEDAAAVTLQRAYRGRLGRLEAEEKRVELAEFISQVRAEEALEEEEEYWKHHRVEKFARNVVAFIKKQA